MYLQTIILRWKKFSLMAQKSNITSLPAVDKIKKIEEKFLEKRKRFSFVEGYEE